MGIGTAISSASQRAAYQHPLPGNGIGVCQQTQHGNNIASSKVGNIYQQQVTVGIGD
ncbi:uncharacterized protein TrAFT101_002521 [Trichoderma asperellum]|uniref:uncharacterized protein n=1 Tax=Trichoderma asperellum TaxID=101201 RepID=UPI00332F04D0|nr:hypothetical protein TrAFT101_002521 [Trichoderma asperellum]